MLMTVQDLMPPGLLPSQRNDPQAARRRWRLLSAGRRAEGICAVSESTRLPPR
jgi:hypothetical protein